MDLQDPYNPNQEMMNRRAEADKAAYVAALLGKPASPVTDFASMYAGDVAPLERMGNDALARPNGVADWSKMVGALLNTGLFRRHQGVYPPARFPDHYDFTKK